MNDDQRNSIRVDCKNCPSPICCEENYSDIYLTPLELDRIIKDSKLGIDEFAIRYWNPYLNKFIYALKTPCVFLQNKKCKIQKVKPLICEIFPFMIDLFTNSITISTYHCKRILSDKTPTSIGKLVALSDYRGKISKFLEDFWK